MPLLPLLDFVKMYPDELSVIKHYISIRYKGKKPTCPHCDSDKTHQYHTRPKFFQCNNCHNTFSIFKNTVFENSKSSLVLWYFVAHLLANGKKGISGCNVRRMIGGSYKRSWRMLNRLRIAFRDQEIFFEDDDILEFDEMYCNAGLRKANKQDEEKYPDAIKAPDDPETKKVLKKISKKASAKYVERNEKEGTQGLGTDKTALFGAVSRESNRAYVKVIFPDEDGKRFTKKRINEEVEKILKGQRPTVITDENGIYNDLPVLGIRHIVIPHKVAFSKEGVNTNKMESVWATIRRMLMGTYHYVSPKLLQSYIDECVFRYNNRLDKMLFKANTFDKFMSQTVLI